MRKQGVYTLPVSRMEGVLPVFCSGSAELLSFRKEALLFAEYVGFGEVFTLYEKGQSETYALQPKKSASRMVK